MFLKSGTTLSIHGKKSVSLAMKCCTGNNLISSVFKAKMPWGKLAHSFRSAEIQRYPSSYSGKYGESPRIEPRISCRIHWNPGYLPGWPHASPEGAIWAFSQNQNIHVFMRDMKSREQTGHIDQLQLSQPKMGTFLVIWTQADKGSGSFPRNS